MRKTYEANTIVGITVQTGKFHRRVSFDQLSNGKSYLVTDSKALQDAIEKHSFFKSGMIRLSAKEDERVAKEPVDERPDGQPTPEGDEHELKKITVAGQSDAVDYLTENFGISRTKLRSQKAIAEAGAVHGVEFVYN